MAARITPEKIEQINELYLQLKVKKRVAEALGISPSTVSKYIVEGYVSKKDQKPVEFDKKPTGAAAMIERIKERVKNEGIPASKAFAEDCNMSEEEWAELKTIQRGILV